VLGPAEAAVIAAERAEVIAVLAVEVVAQDRAAVAEVGAQAEEILAAAADQLRPERHYLHVAARAGDRHGVLAKAALVVNDREHELRIEAGARRLVVDGLQEIAPRHRVADARR